MATCPRCGSNRFQYELRAAGTRSRTNYYRTRKRGKTSWVIPSGRKTYRSQRKQHSVGVCPDCGYTTTRSSGGGFENAGCLLYVFAFIFFPFTLAYLLTVWIFQSERLPLSSRWKTVIAVALWILAIGAVFWAFYTDMGERPILNSNSTSSNVTVSTGTASNVNTTQTNGSRSANVENVWSVDYTPLEDFDYYIDNDEIFLQKYQGRDKKIRIAWAYVVDGITMPVVSLDGTFGVRNVTSVIVPEGVKTIERATFNSCGVKYLYLPASLEEFSGWSYFHDAEKFYYGGTQEQWNALCDVDRSRVDVKRIIYEASIDDLLGDE